METQKNLNHPLFSEVTKAVESVRPFLQKDGGDLEIVEISKKNTVSIKLLGSCEQCVLNGQTFEMGIKKSILSKVPQIKDVTITS